MGSACGRWATASAGLTLKKVQGCMVALNGKHLLWRKNVVNCRGKYESLLNEWGLRMTDHLEDSSYDRPLTKISWLHYYHTLIDKMFPSHSEWIISLSMLLLLPYVHMSFECMYTCRLNVCPPDYILLISRRWAPLVVAGRNSNGWFTVELLSNIS